MIMGRSSTFLAWRVAAAICLSVVLGGRLVAGDDSTHQYQHGEPVVVWLNKIGPWYNPQESYPYYKMPFCRAAGSVGVPAKKPKTTLGEILTGNQLRDSGLPIEFGVDKPRETFCTKDMNPGDVKQFKKMVKEQYLASMYVDDLPLYMKVGVLPKAEASGDADPKLFLHVHQNYTIYHNSGQIIEVKLEPQDPQPIGDELSLPFSFEVNWLPTHVKFENRFDSLKMREYFEHRIHWFSIFNAFMMVIFLCGLVALILLRTLKNDFAKYTTTDEDDMEGDDMSDDSGWKLVHGDVFRAPKHLMLFSALYGTGCQLAVLVFTTILYAIAGPLHGDVYKERGEMVTAIITFYTLTSFISGYTSGSYYRQFFTTPRAEQASQWQRTMVLSAVLVPSVLVPVASYLNMVSIMKRTTNAIPFLVVVKILLVWLFLAFPLCIIGSMFGRHWGGKGNFPCRVNSIPRPIPQGVWYSRPSVVIPLAGILPFGSIFIEMLFILTSLWTYTFYYVYGFLLLVFVILVVVLVCATIVAVYFVLNAENYHWQWVSFLSAGSTAGYVYLYSTYYFFFKTQQTGFLQTSHYFGYMGLFCAALFVMCGSIGVMGSTVFVKQIYRNIKVD